MLDGPVQHRFALPGRGIEISALDWGGEGPLALLHHANGFCGAVWGVVAEELRDVYRVVALDARGHGDSSKPEGATTYDWHEFLHDLVALLELLPAELGYQEVALGAGNSFGGTMMACAAALHPERIRSVAMLDPVVRVRPELLARHGVELRMAEGSRRIVDRTRQRREVWPSRDHARESYRSKQTFEHWHPRALEHYLRFGMREREDGQVELKCPAQIEAQIFEMSGSLDPFEFAPRVRAPTVIAAGRRGHFPPRVFELLAGAMPNARVEFLEGGHLLPMEIPQKVAALLIEHGKESQL